MEQSCELAKHRPVLSRVVDTQSHKLTDTSCRSTALKLKLDISSIFFNLQDVVILKPCYGGLSIIDHFVLILWCRLTTWSLAVNIPITLYSAECGQYYDNALWVIRYVWQARFVVFFRVLCLDLGVCRVTPSGRSVYIQACGLRWDSKLSRQSLSRRRLQSSETWRRTDW